MASKFRQAPALGIRRRCNRKIRYVCIEVKETFHHLSKQSFGFLSIAHQSAFVKIKPAGQAALVAKPSENGRKDEMCKQKVNKKSILLFVKNKPDRSLYLHLSHRRTGLNQLRVDSCDS
jgi:hypothetical protein